MLAKPVRTIAWRCGRLLAEAAERFQAVHHRQVQIEDDDVERLGVVEADGLFAATGSGGVEAPAGHGSLEQFAQPWLVLDDEDPRLVHRLGMLKVMRRSVVRCRGKPHEELAPLSGAGAGRGDSSAVAFDQGQRDRQPEPRARLAHATLFGEKRLEHVLERLGAHPATVVAHAQLNPAVIPGDFDAAPRRPGATASKAFTARLSTICFISASTAFT